MSKLVFTEKNVEEYLNPLECFGNKNIPSKSVGYDPEEPVCIDCKAQEKCKLLVETNGKAPEFLEALAKYSGKTSEKTPEIPEEETQETSEKSPENLPEITREQVRVEIEDCVKAFDPNLKFVYKTLQNRDKIYVNDVEFFDTTKSTLKFCKIKEGAEIGLTPEEYGDSHTGISIDYEIGMEKINFSINEYLLKKLGRKPVEENISEIEAEFITEEAPLYASSQIDNSGKTEKAYAKSQTDIEKETEIWEKEKQEGIAQDNSLKDSEPLVPHVTKLRGNINILKEEFESDPCVGFEVTLRQTTTSCEIKFNGNCCVSDLVKVFSKIKEAAEKLSI